MRVERMNTSRQENQYRFFCTTDPATWETYERRGYDEQHAQDSRGTKQSGDIQGRGEGRGRLGGGKKGEGGGMTKRQDDKGGGVEKGTGTINKANSSIQTEASRNGKVPGVGGGNNVEGSRQEEGVRSSRTYRQDAQKGTGPIQTTLSEMWKAKTSAELRSWSEDMEMRLRDIQTPRIRSKSLSYA
jgi:hypothetical protein